MGSCFICIVDNCFFWALQLPLHYVNVRALGWAMNAFAHRISVCNAIQCHSLRPANSKSSYFSEPFITTKPFILPRRTNKCKLISPTQCNECSSTNKSIHFINSGIVAVLRGLKLARRLLFSIFHMNTWLYERWGGYLAVGNKANFRQLRNLNKTISLTKLHIIISLAGPFAHSTRFGVSVSVSAIDFVVQSWGICSASEWNEQSLFMIQYSNRILISFVKTKGWDL